jgi:hypothetical protein
MSNPEAPPKSPILDFMGREIVAGNTVIYPVRRGSDMWMQRINVTKVTDGSSPSLSGVNPEGRRITIHNLKNVTVVEPVKPAGTI